jgi:hypothetical protein
MTKPINRLLGMKCYLCGAMDRVPDGGVGWRTAITPVLEEMGVIVMDPANKPVDDPAGDESDRETRKAWLQAGDYARLRNFMKKVRGWDLRMVNESSFLVVVVDPDVHLCGSYEEIAIANHEKKPILVHTVGGKHRTPWWLFGMLPHQHIFGSMDELVSYLRRVNSSRRVKTYKRWFFFNRTKLYKAGVLARMADQV